MSESGEKYWSLLSEKEKLSLLQKCKFWDGLSHYKYNYIPEEVKEVIDAEIEEKEANKDI